MTQGQAGPYPLKMECKWGQDPTSPAATVPWPSAELESH